MSGVPQGARVPMLVVIGVVGLAVLVYGLTGGRWYNAAVGVCLLAVVAINVSEGRRTGRVRDKPRRP